MLKVIRTTGTIVLLTALLLEGASYLVILVREKMNETMAQSNLFRQVSPDGSIPTTKDYVFPMKLNSIIRTKTDEYDVIVKTNSRGMRAPIEIRNDEVDVAFFGDSFTFGVGVEWEQIYSTVFSKSKKWANLKVANFSYINGFEPEHYEFFLRSNPDLKPKIVAIGLYLGNDLGSDLHETIYDVEENFLSIPMRRVVTKGNMAANPDMYIWPLDTLVGKSKFVELVVRIVNQTKHRSRLLKVKVGGANEPNETSLETGNEDLTKNRAIQSLLRIQKMQRERNGSLVVLLIPQNFYFGPANAHINDQLLPKIEDVIKGPNLLKQIRKTCLQFDLHCFDSSQVLSRSDYFDRDAHWNASGHGKVGSALAEYLYSSVH